MKKLNLYLIEKLKIDKTVRDNSNDGKVIKTLYKSSNGGALQDRTLEIYQMKTGYKGMLWNSSKRGWKSSPNKPMEIFKAKNINEITNHFGFENK